MTFLPPWFSPELEIEMLGNHLWQSTLFASVAGLLILALRHYPAQCRYWIWFAASLKFLIPFTPFVALGQQLDWRVPATVARAELPTMIDKFSQPFTLPQPTTEFVPESSIGTEIVLPILAAIWFTGFVAILLRWFLRWRRVAIVVRQGERAPDGRELAILRRVEAACGISRPLPLVIVNCSIEPGVFGLLVPTLLWPRGIGERLNDEQLEAIFAHEVAHVRHFDNLAAALHMIVCALFWYHPAVWWIGGRLVDAREQARDDDALAFGSRPEAYAESILRTCQYTIESPLMCVAGVSGSDLKQRVEYIMREGRRSGFNRWRQLALGTFGVSAILMPIAIGAVTSPLTAAQGAREARAERADQLDALGTAIDNAQRPGAPAYEVASVRRNVSGEGPMRLQVQPGGLLNITNVPVRVMLRNAYGVQDFQIVGGPGWFETDRFDITARAEGNPTGPQMSVMLRSLLSDRFRLRLHTELREVPIYSLTLARANGNPGPQMRKAAFDCAPLRDAPPPSAPSTPRSPDDSFNCGFRVGPGRIIGRGQTMRSLAATLSTWVNRMVLDRTAIAGDFDLELQWTPDQMPRGAPPPGAPPLPPIDPNGPSIFTAVQEQLGLKLDAQRGPVEVLVVDSVEPPTPD